ncbi:MAG: T9SS type A sorting domain-containing protein [Bacteroidota bacterium]
MNRPSLLLFMLLLFSSQAQAQTGTCAGGLAEAFLDVNNVNARILNNGGLFWRGSPHVYEVPKYGGANAIFAAGIWIGGTMDGSLRAAASRYGPWEFWPGPLDEAGNPPADCSLYDRVYSVYQRDINEYNETGEATRDLLEWPWDLGAPVIDGDGNPENYNLEGGDRPAIRGHQTVWWVMNDQGNIHEATDSPPIGLEVQVTAYAAASNDVHVNNATLYTYKFIYKGEKPLENTYLGFFQDVDLGNFDDDYVGSDTTFGLGYAYNADNFDEGGEGYGEAPPAVGVKFLSGALVDTDGLDNDKDGNVDEANERLGMTTFTFYNGGGSASGDPVTGSDYYNYMQGQWKDGRPFTVGGTGRDFSTIPTAFAYPGDPVTGTGWSELNPDPFEMTLGPIDPADRRSVTSSGPFTLQPGQSQEITLAVLWARGSDNLDSITQLRAAAEDVQAIFDAGFEITLPDFAPLSTIQLEAPANNIENQPIDPYFSWQASALPGPFELQYDTTPSFKNARAHERIVASNLRILDLSPDSTYYWRVRQVNAGERGPWSATWRFSTNDREIGFLRPKIDGFMTTRNAAGPIDPPDMGAFAIEESGFPILEGNLTPSGSYPDPLQPTPGVQQSTTNATWGIHTGGSMRRLYDNDRGQSFVVRTLRSGTDVLGDNDFEWRFTQRCLDQINGVIEAGDCLAWRAFNDDAQIEVPFELWNIGSTPTQTDSYRMVPIICEKVCGAGTTTGVFDIGQDHAISDGDDDPYTDWVYWYNPQDTSPGETGYNTFFFDNGEVADEILARTVLVQLDGGSAPPYNVALPEAGTVFRLVTEPYPPAVLAAPGSESTQPAQEIDLFWHAISNSIRLQVDTSPQFANPIVDSTVTGISFKTTTLDFNQTYYWRAQSHVRGQPISDWSEVWSFNITQNPAENAKLLDCILETGYPNPFSTQTLIRYAIPKPGPVRLEVFDALGRRVRVLVDAQQTAGWHEALFTRRDLAAGVYFYRLQAGEFTATQSIIVQR